MDLIKENGHVYFVSVLASQNVPADQRTASAFILSVIANNCRPGQTAILNSNLLQVCGTHMADKDPLLRRWSILCAAKIWESFEEAKYLALREGILDQFVRSLRDPIPEVRAATVYSLGLFIGIAATEANDDRMKLEMSIARSMAILTSDASTLVRKELLVAMCKIVRSFEAKIRELVAELFAEEEKAKDPKSKTNNQNSETSQKPAASDSPLLLVWKIVSAMASDSYPPISQAAETVVKHIHDLVLQSPFFAPLATPSKGFGLLTSPNKPKVQPRRLGILKMATTAPEPSSGTSPNSSNTPVTPTSSSMMSASMKKTTSALDFNQFMDEGAESSSNNSPTFSNSPRDLNDVFLWPMSGFYDWSCEYFSKPMLSNDGNIKTSQAEFEQTWRIQRNRTIEDQGSRDVSPLLVVAPIEVPKSPKVAPKALLSDSKGLSDKDKAAAIAKKSNRFDEQVAVIDTGPEHVSSSHICLHPYEPTLIMADHKDGVSVWDREFCKKLNHFRNTSGNVENNAKTTSMVLLNPAEATPLLLLGSDDGVVRVWGNYDDPEDCKILTSWKALPNLVPGSKGSGMVLHYDPFQTQLVIFFYFFFIFCSLPREMWIL
jgi:regulator-associated protein of mTOR